MARNKGLRRKHKQTSSKASTTQATKVKGGGRKRDPELAAEMAHFDLLAQIRSDTGEQGHYEGGCIKFYQCSVCGHHDDLVYYPEANGEHEANTYFCFHCHDGGDSLSYFMARGDSYLDARRKVAPKYAAIKDEEYREKKEKGRTGKQAPEGGGCANWQSNPNLETKYDRNGNMAGYMAPTVPAIAWWLDNDPGLAGVRLETMSQQVTLEKGLPWNSEAKLWCPVDDDYLFARIQKGYKYKGVSLVRSDRNVYKAFSIFCHVHRYDLLLETLEAIPEWDGVERKDSVFVDFLGADDTEYTRAVTSLLLRAALARAYEPGAKFDSMVVLQGPQGIGKSTAISRLALRREFFVDDVKNVGTKEAQEQIQGRWFVEFAELASFKGKSVETLKSFITSPVDSYRVPYDKRSVQLPRRCVLLGTTNQHEYLTDPTGNRRFLPIVCRGGNVARLFDDGVCDYFDQVWAEALIDYRENPGKKLVLPANLLGDAESMRESATTEDPWIGMIGTWLDKKPVGSCVCTMQVIEKALEINKRDIKRADNMRCSQIIRKHFPEWQKVSSNREIEGYGSQRAFQKARKRDSALGVQECLPGV